MTFYIYYRSSDGRERARSREFIGDERLPPGIERKEYANPPPDRQAWDPGIRDFVDRPPPDVTDLAEVIASHPLLDPLDDTTRGRVRDAAAAILDRVELRFQ